MPEVPIQLDYPPWTNVFAKLYALRNSIVTYKNRLKKKTRRSKIASAAGAQQVRKKRLGSAESEQLSSAELKAPPRRAS